MEIKANRAEIVFKDRESAERFCKQFNRLVVFDEIQLIASDFFN